MTNREGQATLFFAVQSGRADVVRFLLDHEAKVDAMGNSGRALLEAAKDKAEIAAMIRAAMPNGSRIDLPSPSR